MTMKTYHLLIAGALLLTSCAPNAQLITLRGSNLKPAADGLMLDNDTLTLRYSFYSERGVMKLTIFNKLAVPLYIDWKKSAFIVGKNKFDYWYDVANVDLSGSAYRFYRVSNLSLSGTISKEDQVAFIPPKTELVKQEFVVLPGGELPLNGEPAVKQEKPTYEAASPKKQVSVQEYSYAPGQSPLTFRSFLTLSTQRDFQKEFYLDTNFWASDVRVMPRTQLEGNVAGAGQFSYGAYQHPYQSPDAFYVIMKTPDSASAR